MSDRQNLKRNNEGASKGVDSFSLDYMRWDAPQPWWLVFTKELRDLWIGGRAFYLMLMYTIMLGVYSYVMAEDSILSLIPPQEMVYELLKAGVVASEFVALIIAADSLSGERERATLEGLLLTPSSRRQIIVGKFLAAASVWPVGFVITIPYLHVLAQGNEVFGQAVLWGLLLGSVLVPTFVALGMLVSFWSNSNKTSFFVSLCVYLFFLLPTQLPGHAQAGFMGQLVQWLNPMAAPRVFLAKLLVNNRGLFDHVGIAPLWSWLLSPALLAVIVFTSLFWYASPGLRLEAGRAGKLRATGLPTSRNRAAGLTIIAGLFTCVSFSPLMAQEAGSKEQVATPLVQEQSHLQISIDMAWTTVKAGDHILYNTMVTNNGTETSPPLIIAMNIINLNAAGEVVDPEDWSPQRTQYLKTLGPGQSSNLSWRVNAILDGDFMVYMVLIPAPSSAEATSQPTASSGIHLTVTPFTRLNPGGVLPYAVGGPIVLGLIIFLVYRHRHRKLETGASS